MIFPVGTDYPSFPARPSCCHPKNKHRAQQNSSGSGFFSQMSHHQAAPSPNVPISRVCSFSFGADPSLFSRRRGFLPNPVLSFQCLLRNHSRRANGPIPAPGLILWGEFCLHHDRSCSCHVPAQNLSPWCSHCRFSASQSVGVRGVNKERFQLLCGTAALQRKGLGSPGFRALDLGAISRETAPCDVGSFPQSSLAVSRL